MFSKLSILTSLLLSWATLTTSGVCAEYSITELGGLSSRLNTYPSDINNSGQIAGYSFSSATSNYRAFILQQETFTDLGDLPGGDSLTSAGKINSEGQVIGDNDTQTGTIAFVWQNGGLTNLGSLNSDPNVTARSINDYGQIVGTSGITPFIWQDGVMTNFNTLPGADYINAVWAINNKGAVAGTSISALYQHAVVWSAGTVTDLGDLPGGTGMFNSTGDWSVPQAINDMGQVVGTSDSAAGIHPFFWDNGKMVDMGTLPGNWRIGSANDINNNGVAVGSFSGNNTSRPFIWDQNNGLRDLNDLIANAPDGWVLQTAMAINDLGQIVGEGTRNGELRGFLLTPLPEPPTALLAVLAAVLFVPFFGYRSRIS